jgi:ABC-type glycerol-3-phosphate transport system substrate-binding protein
MDTAALAGQMPDLLWTHGQQIGALAANERLRPVGDLVQLSDYTPAAVAGANANGIQWGVPIASGDCLVLFRNRRWMPEPPATTDALLALPKPDGVEVLLAADQLSPAWLAAWVAGFDGTAPVSQTQTRLNPRAIVSTLFFLKELRDRQIIPADMDAGSAAEAFRSGRAAMLVASAWSLATLTSPDGAAADLDVGITALPMVAASGHPPRPSTSGAYLLVSASASGEEVEVARQLARFLASPEIQARVASDLRRLPATNAALQDERITSDPHMQAVLASLSGAVPLSTDGIPQALEASIPIVAATLNGEKSPEAAAEEIQTAAEANPPTP